MWTIGLAGEKTGVVLHMCYLLECWYCTSAEKLNLSCSKQYLIFVLFWGNFMTPHSIGRCPFRNIICCLPNTTSTLALESQAKWLCICSNGTQLLGLYYDWLMYSCTLFYNFFVLENGILHITVYKESEHEPDFYFSGKRKIFLFHQVPFN